MLVYSSLMVSHLGQTDLLAGFRGGFQMGDQLKTSLTSLEDQLNPVKTIKPA